jgi:excisionase family DNA binding protein
VDVLLTPTEVADRLKVQVRTLHGWRCRNEGPPAVRIGKYLRYPESELVRWLEKQAALSAR